MKKQGYVISLGKKRSEFFSTTGSYQRPTWTTLEEATVYYSADQASAAAKKLWQTGHFSAKVISLNEVDVVHSPDSEEDCELTPTAPTENEEACPSCGEQHSENEECGVMHVEDEAETAHNLHNFKKGQTVAYNGNRHVVLQANPDSTLITLAPEGMEANPRAIVKADARQLQTISERKKLNRRSLQDVKECVVYADGKKVMTFKTKALAKAFVKHHEKHNPQFKGKKLTIKESFTPPKAPNTNTETPKNTNEIPNLGEPYKSKEIEFDWPSLDPDREPLSTATAWEHEENVKIPAEVKSELKAAIEEFQKCADFNYARDDARASFCMTVHDALQMLMDDLDEGTVEGVKQAQIHLSSFMNPITTHVPEIVRDFIYRGGRKKSLKDFFDNKRKDI